MRAAHAVTAKATEVVCQCSERMLARGLANLFEPLIVAGAAAQPIEILRNDRMIVAR